MDPTQTNFDLEAVYDEQIAPLMTQIIDICQKHKLPMFATFFYRSDVEGVDDGENRACTTNMLFPKDRPVDGKMQQLAAIVRRRDPGFLAIAITKK